MRHQEQGDEPELHRIALQCITMQRPTNFFYPAVGLSDTWQYRHLVAMNSAQVYLNTLTWSMLGLPLTLCFIYSAITICDTWHCTYPVALGFNGNALTWIMLACR